MLNTSTSFDTKHEAKYKTPLYLIHFDGETIDYCNHKPTSPTYALKQYLTGISGLNQQITPEEGKGSIGGITFGLLDEFSRDAWAFGDIWAGGDIWGDTAWMITNLIASDTYNMQRKKTTIKAGYKGMSEADLATIFTGWVTDIKLASDGAGYTFQVTDPQKWMQRKIFRDSETTPITLSGNAITLLLKILCSTGDGTNGDYDKLAEVNGLGIDTDFIDVAGIEAVRDDWFPGNTSYVSFTISKREKAKDFLEREIFKVFNLYPVVDGQGRFTIKPFKPPLAALDTVQTFTEDNIIGLPSFDMNFSDLVNEVEFHYNHNSTTDEFDNELFYSNSSSLANRGPGKKPINIKSKGLHTASANVSAILTIRKNRIFNRFSVPPLRVVCKTFFTQWISEVGDIVPVTHSKLPDMATGDRGLVKGRMEIINKSVDWKRGQVNVTLLDTGFKKDQYAVISPVMTITTAANSTSFTVPATDAAKYSAGWVAQFFDAGMRPKSTSITLASINSTTGAITCDDIGATPAAGWKVQFAVYDDLSTDQKLYWELSSASTSAPLLVP